MEVSEKLRSTYEDKTPRALKTDRILHRATLNTSIASPGKTLNVTVPKLDEGVVLVPGSLGLVFNLVIGSHANNFLVNNFVRALVEKFKVKFAGDLPRIFISSSRIFSSQILKEKT